LKIKRNPDYLQTKEQAHRNFWISCLPNFASGFPEKSYPVWSSYLEHKEKKAGEQPIKDESLEEHVVFADFCEKYCKRQVVDYYQIRIDRHGLEYQHSFLNSVRGLGRSCRRLPFGVLVKLLLKMKYDAATWVCNNVMKPKTLGHSRLFIDTIQSTFYGRKHKDGPYSAARRWLRSNIPSLHESIPLRIKRDNNTLEWL
jgi:hypothetical protein